MPLLPDHPTQTLLSKLLARKVCHFDQNTTHCIYSQLRYRLHNHVVELTPLTTDRANLVSQANDYVSTTSHIRGLLQEKNKRITIIKEATSECRRINEECSQGK